MRGDSTVVGFIGGLFAPVLGFFLYGAIYVTAIRPFHDITWFVKDLFLGTPEYRAPVLSLSLIADAGLFFLFDRKGMQRSMRGVITAMFLYGIAIVILMFL